MINSNGFNKLKKHKNKAERIALDNFRNPDVMWMTSTSTHILAGLSQSIIAKLVMWTLLQLMNQVILKHVYTSSINH